MTQDHRQRASIGRRAMLGFLTLAPWPLTSACTDTGKVSAEKAVGHARLLLKAANEDVEEIRRGLPKALKHLEPVFEAGVPDSQTAQKALETARNKVQDLRVAKSTFFALVDKDGSVIRNDQQQDLMVGKNAFKAYKELRGVLAGKVVETQGSMKEAAGVRGKPDAQWVIGAPIKAGGKTVAAYVTGWSWSSYAYRLETAVRSEVLSKTEEGGKVPLLYVYVLSKSQAYGAPISPIVNGDAIVKANPLQSATIDKPFSQPLEIEGRQFGLSVIPFEKIGKGVGIAVLRSET
jgi:hypothetical protein